MTSLSPSSPAAVVAGDDRGWSVGASTQLMSTDGAQTSSTDVLVHDEQQEHVSMSTAL